MGILPLWGWHTHKSRILMVTTKVVDSVVSKDSKSWLWGTQPPTYGVTKCALRAAQNQACDSHPNVLAPERTSGATGVILHLTKASLRVMLSYYNRFWLQLKTADVEFSKWLIDVPWAKWSLTIGQVSANPVLHKMLRTCPMFYHCQSIVSCTMFILCVFLLINNIFHFKSMEWIPCR